jgi:hypothetical protein
MFDVAVMAKQIEISARLTDPRTRSRLRPPAYVVLTRDGSRISDAGSTTSNGTGQMICAAIAPSKASQNSIGAFKSAIAISQPSARLATVARPPLPVAPKISAPCNGTQ